MRAKKTDTEIRKRQIVKAAMALISDGGISNLNIAGIAEKIGIVPSAVYRHFKNKEEILSATLNLLRKQLQSNIKKVETEASGALARLHLLLKLHAELLNENPVFPHIVFAHFSQTVHEERWSSLNSAIYTYLRGIARIAEKGQQDGEIRSDIPPHNIAMLFLGLVLPGAMLHRLSEDQFELSQHLEAVWPVFVKGLEITDNVKNKELV